MATASWESVDKNTLRCTQCGVAFPRGHSCRCPAGASNVQDPPLSLETGSSGASAELFAVRGQAHWINEIHEHASLLGQRIKKGLVLTRDEKETNGEYRQWLELSLKVCEPLAKAQQLETKRQLAKELRKPDLSRRAGTAAEIEGKLAAHKKPEGIH